MYLKTHNEYECCGCGACKSACPKSCIDMVPNEQGFRYPVIVDKEKCIHCGLCEKVCVFEKKEKCINENPTCYYGWHNDPQIRQESTSGAAFIAITQACQELGYKYFCGAVYDQDNIVKHICTNNINDIFTMKTSKYVQSDLKNTFTEIKELLKKGEKVLFSGTPCQTEGLRSFVGERYNKQLLTVALVCHGVSSPLCFEKYKESLEKKYSSKIKSIRFRDKRIKDGKLNHRFTTVRMENGTCIESTENPYTMMFGLGFMHRKSCSRCQYTTPLRNCDLTIGDFWGIQLLKPELEDELSNGISLLLVHTLKGEAVCEYLNKYMKIEKMPSYTLCVNKIQQQLSKPFAENPDRDIFIRKVTNNKDFLNEANKVLFIRRIKMSLNFRLGKIAKKLRIRV